MIRTLRMYLARDLAKATALSAVVITLVMTVFAVIEPLRNRGLSSQQAVRLFGFSMPVMVSLTLPIAALFAAAIVYGRFAQDNELMACRASGVSTLAILKPAVWLGAIISVGTLVLGLYVAPGMMGASQASIRNNLKQIAYHKLKTRGHLRLARAIIHADHLIPDSDVWEGVVVVDMGNPEDVACAVAASARPEFVQREGQGYVVFHISSPAYFRQDGQVVGRSERQHKFEYGRIPSLFEEKPQFFGWGKLYETLKDPKVCSLVRERVLGIRREITIHKFLADLRETIGRTGRYELRELSPEAAGPAAGGHRVVIEAPAGQLDRRQAVVLGAAAAAAATAPADRPVAVRQYVGERLEKQYRARSARVAGRWEEFHSTAVITVELEDVDISVPPSGVSPGPGGDRPDMTFHRDREELGTYAVPADIAARSDPGLDELYDSTDQYAGSPYIGKMLEDLNRKVIPRLLHQIRAEMHQRWAYGAGCMLMVMLGAGLGLLLRGGQVLVAFAISAVVGGIINVLLMMGRQLISNGMEAPGVCVIWGAVAALGLLTAYFYLFPLRR